LPALATAHLSASSLSSRRAPPALQAACPRRRQAGQGSCSKYYLGAPRRWSCGLTLFSLPTFEFFRPNSYRAMGSYMLKFCADPKIFAAIKSLILASKN
jgi:hypothetical protein